MPKDGKYGQVSLEKRPDAPLDEPCFVLRGQDILAPIAVRYYADLVEAAIPAPYGKNAAEVIRARAVELAVWPKRKLPDGI
jgi:hypothetical protein